MHATGPGRFNEQRQARKAHNLRYETHSGTCNIHTGTCNTHRHLLATHSVTCNIHRHLQHTLLYATHTHCRRITTCCKDMHANMQMFSQPTWCELLNFSLIFLLFRFFWHEFQWVSLIYDLFFRRCLSHRLSPLTCATNLQRIIATRIFSPAPVYVCCFACFYCTFVWVCMFVWVSARLLWVNLHALRRTLQSFVCI